MHMGRGRRFAVFAIVAVVALAIGYGAWRVEVRALPEQCYACQRPIHAHSRTLAFAGGKSRLYCCPACALSEHRQESKDVKITELTEYLTGAKLAPNDAWVVKGSDINMCAQAHEMMVTDKRRADVQYDRCAPSFLAFAQEREAQQFSREHGGTVLPFPQVAASYAR
jgi:hypothetical protein